MAGAAAASSAAAGRASKRWAWTGLMKTLRYRVGRLYDSFYYGQYTTKYALAVAFPLVMWTTRFRTDTKLFYHVYVANEEVYPDMSTNVVSTTWKNGKKFFLPDDATVGDLKKAVYAEGEGLDGLPAETAAALRVGCHGRMMDDTDNLALAVKAFCRRDPKLVIWREDF